MSIPSVLWSTFRQNQRQILLRALGFVVATQVFMLVALMIRFWSIPNYVTFYDWIGNAAWILQSTPSWGDAFAIIWEEWLVEIGWMNYEYGTGISVWSLNIIPSRLLVLFGLGLMIALCLCLVRNDTCDASTSRTLKGATGLGAFLVVLTNATMSWVVCCATPTWVVGLAMLGLGVSASFAIEPLGPLFAGTGFGLLTLLAIGLAWRKARGPVPKRRRSTTGGVTRHA